MSKKSLKTLGMLLVVVAIVSSVLIIYGNISVYADNGETVRVSTAKQLKAAIKNANVGKIIFRTDAYINVKIKADENAKSKSLVIDAPHVNFTNKAVFSDINIYSANRYIESVSGNRISLSDSHITDGFFVSKKKKVKSLKIYNSNGEFSNKYTLRKGAKIKALELIYSEDSYPVKSSYDKSKRQLTIEGSYYDYDCFYTIELDKNGRMMSIICESGFPEADYEVYYTYDSSGNIVKLIGTDKLSGEFCKDITYSGNLELNSIYKDKYDSIIYTQSYDEAGRLVHREFKGENGEDGEILKYGLVYDCEYDKKGRLSYERWEDPESGYFEETSYTYNSKGFLTMMYSNDSGAVTVYEYKYNKAGSIIEETQTSEGYNETLTFEYDELGERITD